MDQTQRASTIWQHGHWKTLPHFLIDQPKTIAGSAKGVDFGHVSKFL
jgi:hypothetical protein